MYLILSGGFFGLSHKQEIWGFTPIKLGDANRGVDFIVKVDGLPDELVKAEGTKVHYKYWCDKCKSYVPEWDMERKQGCFFHDPDPQKEEKPEWRIGVLEEYKNASKPWIKNAIRIWLDSQPGQEKWIAIKRYIEHNYPVNKSLAEVTPVPVGTRTEWLLEETEIPFIDFNKVEKPIEKMTATEVTDTLLKRIVELENKLKETKEEVKVEPPKAEPVKEAVKGEPKCDVCGKVCADHRGLVAHKRIVHEEKKNGISNNFSNTNNASPVHNEADKVG